MIGTGKSTLLEYIGIKHNEKGATILDLFGSVDGESLAWLRSPIIKDKRVCLLRDENVDVDTDHDVKMVENRFYVKQTIFGCLNFSLSLS